MKSIFLFDDCNMVDFKELNIDIYKGWAIGARVKITNSYFKCSSSSRPRAKILIDETRGICGDVQSISFGTEFNTVTIRFDLPISEQELSDILK
jgi:hypothetical protein